MPLSAAERDKMPADQFAVPSKRELPLHDRRHIKLAWDMVDRTKGLSDEERKTARERILAAAKKVGLDTDDWEKEAMDAVNVHEYVVLDSTAGKPMSVRFKGTQANIINENNALYPTEVLADAIQRMKEQYVKPGKSVGESPHPVAKRSPQGKPVFDTKVENSVWKITDVFMDADGGVFFDAEILGTAKGKDVEAMIRQGVPVGDSMRAIARWTTRQINGRPVKVATHLDIPAFDCVMNPATPGSEALQILTDSQIQQIMSELPPYDPTTDSVVEATGGVGEPTTQYAVLGPGQTVTDSVKFTDKPIDPSSGEELTPQDPDGDGDVDFYTNKAGEVFTTERRISHESHAHHYLRKMPPHDDGDNHALARQWQMNNKPKPATDSRVTQGDDPMPSIEDLVASPVFQQAVAAAAQQVARPALDALQLQEQERAKEATKAEAQVHIKSRLESMKGKLPDKTIAAILDSIAGKADTKEQADIILDTAIDLVSKAGAGQALNALGFNGTANQNTAARVEVTHEPKPWQHVVDSMVKAFDDYGRELGHEPDLALRKLNKPIIDRILTKFERDNGHQQMTDSGAFMDSVSFDNLTDAISTTTGQLLNQPTVLEAVIVQAFQDVEASQFMMIETFDGSEWRIPVETFTSAATPNSATGLIDIIVAEGSGIPEANTNLNWLSFAPSWRRNAFSMTEDALRNLLTGPAKYPAVARAIYHLGYEKRRRLDLAAYYEMILASDEYNPTVVTNETAAAANVKAVSNGTNVAYSYQLQAAAGSTFPVVRPRSRVEITSASGQTSTVTTNPFSCTVGGTALVAGYLDTFGNVQSFAGTTATYAVNYEEGTVYFTSGAGLNPTATTPIVPSFPQYSASTNYDTWHYTQPTSGSESTVPIEQFYNTLLQQITRSTALMGSSPRFKKPNMAIMSLNTSAYIENAAMWYKLNSPDGSEFTPVTDNNFGKRSGVSFNRINAPWVAGDGRILLSQKGSTRYGIQTPYEMQGPFAKYDSNGDVIDARVWYGRENSVLATPQVTDLNGNIINPVSRTIRIVP